MGSRLKIHYTCKDDDGNIIAEAELGIESEKIVFSPFDDQCATIFRNNGYTILTPEEYIKLKKL